MLSDNEVTQVMFFISCHDQDNPVVKHLTELHRLRDKEVQECVEDSFISDDDVVNYNRVMRMRNA